MRKITVFGLLISVLLLQGCGGGSSSSSNETGGSSPPTPVDTWTLSGTFEFPANETATNLKLVVTADATQNNTSAYVSDPVTLTLTGTPPTATFTLDIDTTRLGPLTGPQIVDMWLWQDVDGDGVHDISEAYRVVDPSTGSNVWCTAGVCSTTASFSRIPAGTSGYSSVDGSYAIKTTGWYYEQGCNSYACAQLVSGPLTGAKVTYEYNAGAITASPTATPGPTPTLPAAP